MTWAPFAKSPNWASQSDERLGPLHAVAVVETHDGELRERAVAGLEVGLLRIQRREGRPGLAGRRVVEDRVAVGEGSPARVLAADADRRAFEDERAERERLGGAPVERQRALGHLRPAGELLDHLGVEAEARGHRRQRAADRGERLAGDARLHLDDSEHALRASRGDFAARTARGLLGRGQRRLVLGELARLELLHFLFGHDAFTDEPPRVERADPGVGLDRLVHQGLGVGRLVAFVVPVAAESDQVDDDVLVELLPVVESDLEHAVRGLRIVGVDVKDRDLVDLGHVGRVHGGAPLRRRRRESDLVVDDDVDRPARPVARQLGEIEDLGHHPLPGERRVPVEEHRQDGFPGGGAVAGLALLLGADHAFHDGVDGLEVRGVRFDLDGDLLTGLGLPDRARALVILHVALVGREVGMDHALEAREDPLGRVADDVRQDVQPPAVGHADHDLVDAAGRRVLDQPIEQRNRRLAALDRVAALSQELRAEEALELFGRDELHEDALADVGGQGLGGGRGGDVRADPVFFFRARDVAVFGADLAAVHAAHERDDVAQGHPVSALEPARVEIAVEIPDRQPVGRKLELGMLGDHAGAERIDVGEQMAPHAVRVDELEDAGLLGDVLAAAVVGERAVDLPAQGAERDPEIRENAVVEAVLAEKELLDAGKESPGFRALDDPVVVRGGERHDLADREPGQHRRRGGGELRGIVDRAGRDDGSLAGHQARNRSRRAERAGIRQGDRRPFEIRNLQLARPGARDDVVGSRDELAEGHLFRALDVGDEKGARTVRLGDVHGQTEADLLAPDARGLPSHRLEGVVHRGECLHALDHGPRDEVRERDLGLLRLRPRLVDEPAVFIEQFDRDLALGGRRRHGQARLHVLGDSRGGAAQRDPLADDGRRRGRRGGSRRGTDRRRGRRLCGSRRRRSLDLRRRAEPFLEVAPPFVVDRGRVGPVPIQQVLDIARVSAELGEELLRHIGRGRACGHKEGDSRSGGRRRWPEGGSRSAEPP